MVLNMALGGGTFSFQNKALPGTYINFVSAASPSSSLSDRGVVAMALPLPWGPCGEMITVTGEAFMKHSLSLFGRAYTHPDLLGLRELFAGANTAYLFRLGAGGKAAGCSLADARYPGSLGNGISLVVTEEADGFGVETLVDGAAVDYQAVESGADLQDNAFVRFKGGALAATAGIPLTGGTDGTPSAEEYGRFLDLSESYGFHTMGCLSTDSAVKDLFAAHTRRMRDDAGVKFQCVLHRYPNADHEGILSVENACDELESGLVYWVTGISAGCAVHRSNTNRVYTGALSVQAEYTQAALTQMLGEGRFVLHRVGGDIRVMEDINTFVSATAEKSADFSMNQTVRVIDQVATDIAGLFASRYLGRIPNDHAGRLSLWSDIVSHHRKLAALGAIDDFDPVDVVVEAGENKRSVVITDRISPTCAISQLYMTVVVQ